MSSASHNRRLRVWDAHPGNVKRLTMLRKKKTLTLDTIKLTNPQRASVARLLAMQKHKYKKLLHEAHERMHIIADLSTSLEFWYNVNGSYEFVSPSCESVLGYSSEDFIRHGVRLEGIVHSDELDRFRKDKSNALSGGSGVDREYRFIAKDGSPLWMLMTWNPVMTRNGKHIGVRISLRDITDVKNCRHFSVAYRELMLAIADELTETAIFSFSSSGEILSWNAAASMEFGYSRDEVLEKDILMLLAEESELPDSKAFASESRINRNMLLRKRDGGSLRYSVKLFGLVDYDNVLRRTVCLVQPSRSS